MTKTTKIARKHLPLDVKFALRDFIRPLLTKQLDGFWHYTGKYSDTVVAQEFSKISGHEVTEWHVRMVRWADKLDAAPRGKAVEKAGDKRITYLEQRVDKLSETVSRLVTALGGYEDAAE